MAGSAWSNQVVAQLLVQAGQAGQGIFVYNGPPGFGNLIGSWSAAAGTDPFGNPYYQGLQLVGVGGLTNVFTVTDTSGNVLAKIDGSGNINGATISAATDVLVAGNSLLADLFTTPIFPLGLVNYGFISTTGNWPSTAVGTTETALFELDQVVTGGRVYEFALNPGIFVTNTAGVVVHLFLRFTTDGTTPSTSSTLATSVATFVSNNASAEGHPGMRCPFFPSANGTYRFLVTGDVNSGTFQFASADPFIRCEVHDVGTFPPANNIIALGSGSGGGNSKQNYTKTYSAQHTYAYEGSTGHQPNTLFNTDGVAQQGGDFANTYNGDSYSWILWPYSTIQSDLSGATVNWVKLKLTNQHSWYDAGVTAQVGWDTRTSFPGTTPQPVSLNNQVNQFFTEGQTITYYVDSTGSTWGTAFQSGGATTTLMAASTSDLHYYGYFAGHTAPQLIINYTK